jgi:hypothetical protein
MGAGLLARGHGVADHQAFGIAVAVFGALKTMVPDITSDQEEVMSKMAQLVMQTSADVRVCRIQSTKAAAAAMQVQAASDGATAGMVVGAVSGVAAGFATGGNLVAMSAAANAGSNMASSAYTVRGDQAATRELDKIVNYFGEYV